MYVYKYLWIFHSTRIVEIQSSPGSWYPSPYWAWQYSWGFCLCLYGSKFELGLFKEKYVFYSIDRSDQTSYFMNFLQGVGQRYKIVASSLNLKLRETEPCMPQTWTQFSNLPWQISPYQSSKIAIYKSNYNTRRNGQDISPLRFTIVEKNSYTFHVNFIYLLIQTNPQDKV